MDVPVSDNAGGSDFCRPFLRSKSFSINNKLQMPGFSLKLASDKPEATGTSDAQIRSYSMEWVLFVSLQWIVYGSPTQPTTQLIQSFASEELCQKAAEALKNEMGSPLGGGARVQTLGRVVCLLRKDK